MEKRNWIVIDANYMCHRNFHAFGSQLTHEDISTGVIYGFLRDVISLQDTFQSTDVVFCFDSKELKRKEIHPTYKSTRKKKFDTMDDDQLALYREFYEQIGHLRWDYLPSIGYRNVFSARGFEADDLIAKVKEVTAPKDEHIIVSSDTDLYQLLDRYTILWNPFKSKAYNARSLQEEYGCKPIDWAMVKSIAGDTTDDILGVNGVGLKSAAQYIAGKMKRTSKRYKDIRANEQIWQANLQLVTLPMEGCPGVELSDDKVTADGWDEVCSHLGMRSLVGKVPKQKKRDEDGKFGFGF